MRSLFGLRGHFFVDFGALVPVRQALLWPFAQATQNGKRERRNEYRGRIQPATRSDANRAGQSQTDVGRQTLILPVALDDSRES